MTMQKESGKNVAIILSGCGVFDGSEIHEAVIAILSARKAGASVKFFAPDIPQADVVNHLSGNAEPLPREVLSESARIARGKISPLSELNAKKFDAIIFPGGFGAAKNLSSFSRSLLSMPGLISLMRTMSFSLMEKTKSFCLSGNRFCTTS